jgi:hypothetical protein
VGFGIKNTGERAAGPTGINFLVPDDLRRLRWETQQGRPDPGKKQEVLLTAEELEGSDGTRSTAQYLFHQYDRVSKRTHYVGWVGMEAPVPRTGERRVPMKFKVWSDELPDDVEERQHTIEVRVRRV